jgi:hypothetical protein
MNLFKVGFRKYILNIEEPITDPNLQKIAKGLTDAFPEIKIVVIGGAK